MTAAESEQLSLREIGTLVACLFGMGSTCLVFVPYAAGPFVYPLSAEFGWSRQGMTTAATIVTMVTLATSFVIGWIADTASPKWLAVPSQIALGLCYFALAAFTNGDIRIYFALHLLLGIVAAGALPIVFNRVVAVRFIKHRGTALGVMMTGSGVCGLLLPPYLTIVIEQYGWRAGFVAAGCVPIAIALLLSLTLLPTRADPAPTGDAPAPQTGVTLFQAMRSWKFWMLGACFFIGAGLSIGVVVSLVPMLRDMGMDPVAAAGAMGVFGLAVVVGRVLIGVLVDRFWAPPVALAVMVPAAGALFFLASQPVSVSAAYICAFLLGLAAGAEADMLAYLGVRYFGTRQAARIYAVMYVFFTLGIGVSAPLWGRVYDIYGNYTPVLWFSGVGWIICGLMFVSLGPYPKGFVPATGVARAH